MYEGGCAMSYTLPIASDVQLGGIKVGSKLTIDSEGVLDVDLSYVQAGIDKYAKDLKEGKEDLASALTAQGITSSANESLHDFSKKIRKLSTSQIGAGGISPKIPQIQSTLNLNIRNESYKEVTV